MISKVLKSVEFHFEPSRKVRFKVDLWNFLCVLICIVSPCLARNHPPQFLINGQTEIVVRLREGPETPVGSLIYKLKGIDPDGDDLTFGVKDQLGSDVIRVENFGRQEANVYLNKLLDRETKDEYALVLTLTDGKLGDGNFITQSLLLLVDDINDNAPVFRSHPTTLTIREDSGPGILTTVEATDADEGAHGQVVYQLQELDGDNDVFSISTVNGKGVVRLVGKLDYEKKYLYQLRILAVDRAINGKVNTGTSAILVKIQDVEDQPPEFIAMTPVAKISENAKIGTSVLQVRAIDGDKGINNRVSYSITEGPRHLFDIDSHTGLVFTRSQLDREADDNSEGAFVLEITVKEISKKVPTPSVTTEVTIILTDVNDETPRFRNDRYIAEINENAPKNTPVNFIGDAFPEVYDHDLGTNGTFQMFINGDGEIFEITPSRGINEAPFLIRVKESSELDFERRSVINFTIVAKELVPFQPKFSVVPVTVYIKDQNDNYPEFTMPIYEVNIPENCPVGTTVAWVQASDDDSGNYGTRGIRYTNLGGSIAYALKLNSTTGIITVKDTGLGFDRELVARHYLTVEARDDLGKGNRNSVQLVVNIDDVNDNPPVFLQTKYEAVLLENKKTFESPVIVEAFDIDLNTTRNSEIVYSLAPSEFSRNFTIDPKRGIVTPVGGMDYEALPMIPGHRETSIRPLKLTIRARDKGTPSLSSEAPLIVYLKDLNDNEPMFERALYQKNIPEDLPGGTNILQVKAWDKDLSSPNNKLVYRIQHGAGDKFVISPENGIIKVAPGSNLDPDLTSPKTTKYVLTVVAIDSGTEIQRSAEVLVNISIVDVNNKPPVFIDPGTVAIRENTQVGAYVHRVVANDPDIAPVLRYRIDPNSSEARNEEGTLIKVQEYDYLTAFELNALDGLLRVIKLLDRERVETIKLGLVVEDLGAVRGTQTASAILNVIIEDENDNNPRFRRPFYRRSVTENSKNGVHIVSVVADDADKNRTITYSMESPREIADLVHLDPDTGEIVVANKIDREQYSWLNLTIRATDSGIPPRSSLSEVYVQVLDENDNNPYFITDINNITVPENIKVGTEVVRIEAKDPDSGDYGKITYLLDRMSSQEKFIIHPETGAISVANKLDWKIKNSYLLIIEAWDNYHFGYSTGESRNAFKQVEVIIGDVNDNGPKLEVPQECVTISEFHDMRDAVAVIKATDADDPSTPNGRVMFRILTGNEMGLFMLEQTDYWTAKIKAVKSLRGRFGNYSLHLEARDLGSPVNEDNKYLNICVLDYNDNPPVFLSPQHNTTIRVPENITVGSTIIQVEAKDADTGLNGDVHYRLKQDLTGHWRSFHIDDKTGVVTLKQPLDRETQKMYEIRIEAFDLGTPTPLSSDLDLIIYVKNVNDYEPQFLVDIFTVTFTEEKPPKAEEISLPETVDRDEVDDLDDPPTQVCYFIIGGNDDGYFTLDIFSHKLTTAKKLDRETQEEHLLLVKATEDCSSAPANQSFFDENDDTLLKVVITVKDINDHSPKFVSKVFTGGVTTEADFGTQVIHVKAIDPDAGDNAAVSYYQVGKVHMTLTEGLDDMNIQPFLVDRLTGAVTLNFDPQPRMKGYFDFMVLANDTDGLHDTARVFIYLLREDQRVRFVLRQHPPEIRNRIDNFREILGNVTGAIVNVDEYKVHENQDGSVDRTRTDLYLHLVNRHDNSILDVSQVLELVDRNIEKLDTLFKDFNVLDTQPAESQPIVQYEQAATTFWLLVLTVFLGALLILCIALCLSQRASFQRQLKAANASPFGTTDSEFMRGPGRVPNTNKHSVEGSNPIWMHAYENEWFKSDESFSHRSDRDSLDENALNNEEMNEANSGERATNENIYYTQPNPTSISRMLLKGCFKIWISLSLVLMGTKGSRPRFDTSTDMGMVLVPADAEVDSVIFRLRATDQDVDFPLVFDITSTISPVVRIENLPCTLYNKVCQANVILTRRLTAGRLHDFAVRVRDSKGDSNSMQATISVTNATTPRDTIFPHIPTLIMVPEDTKPGKELDYILVKSNPWSGKPVYIELWQPKELFTIRQRLIPGHTRGTIILTGELDFETQSMYTLTIYATDPYTEPRKDTRNIAGLHLIVIVQDVQDVPPIFTLAPPLTKLNNTVQPGDVILRVHAEDGDKGVPREISYGLVSEGNPFTPFFNITETTGEIILARPLEELTQITHVGAPIVLSIVAEEIRRSTDEPPAQATVVKVGLLLGEPGNSPPYFENDNYVAWMDENAEPGTSIIFEEPYITKVRDEDIGKAGVFTLKLDNNNGTFEISPSVAERNANFILTVRDNSLIDYEIYKSLRFKIVAQEVGPATNLSASVPVTIFLRDKNDNPPEFEEASYEVTLSENVTAGTRVTQVHATDKDTGFFGRIQYTRIIGPGSEAFAINPDTGVITVSMDTSSLDREITPQLQLIVEACDEDGRGLRGTVPFIVNLLDANDNAPIFEKDTYEFVLNLDLTNFTVPAIIKAFDADAESPNNEVRYEIIHGNYDNKFILNDTTGELFLREPITKTRSTRHNGYQRFATKLKKNIVSTSESPQKISSSTQKTFDLSTILSVLNDNHTIKNHTIKNNTELIKRRKREDKNVLFTLTVRAYDLGVPHLSGTTQVKILQSPQAGVRTLMFLVPGEHPDRIKTAQTLATITGGRVTVMEIRPYTPGSLPNGVEDIPTSGTGKRSIVVAKVEYTGSESSVVDIEKIRAALAANGVGVIGGDMSPNGNTEINPPVTNQTINKNNTSPSLDIGTNGGKTTTVVSDGTNINKTTIITNREEVIVYKAENKLLFWLLIILGLLVLAAIIILIVCCICPGCPFYMAPRKRRVRSSDTFIARVDGRPKRHIYRKYPQTDVTWSEKKQAWSANQPRDNWQFNRRNIRNYGIASLPGDVVCDDRDREFPRKAYSLRLQDATEPIHIVETRKRGQDRLYVEDVEGFRVKGYDVPDMDSLRQNEIERGSDMTREAYVQDIREKDQQTFRDQQFYRSGNAEVMRLVTRGVAEGNITYRQPEIVIDQVHRVDGKDILLRRFIEDQNLRVNQEYHGSMQDLEKQSMESHKRQKEASMQQQQQPEIILIPEQLEQTHRQHIEELGPDVQRLIIDHGIYDKSAQSDIKESQDAATGTTLIIQGAIPKASELPKEQNIPKYPVNVQHYSIHDLELARQNALLTRLLLERDRGVNAAMMDTGSYLETQSLPGQVAAGTQTNQTIATQTEQQSRSRSDNEESEEDARMRRKMRSKKRYDGEAKRVRALWMRSPIREEDREYSEKDTNFIRKKIKDIKDARKSNIEPEVLREISDSLDETGDRETPVRNRESFGDSSNSRYESRDEIPQRDDSSSIEMSKDEYTRAHGRRVDDRNETRKKEKEVTGKEEAQGVKKSSFKILEREISSLSKKLSKLTGKKIQSKHDSYKNNQMSKDSDNNDINVTSPDTYPEDEKKLKKVDGVRSKRSISMQRVTKLASKHLKMPDGISDKNKKQQKLKSTKKPLVSTASSELEEIDRLKTQVTTKESEGETSKSSVRKVTKAKLNRQVAVKEKDISSVEKKKDILVKQSKKLDDKMKKSELKLKHIKEDRSKIKKAVEMTKKFMEDDHSKESDKRIQKWKTKPSRKQENSSTDESQTSKDSRDSGSKIFSNKTSVTSPTETLESPKAGEITEEMIDIKSTTLDDQRKSLIAQHPIDSSSKEIQLIQMDEKKVTLEVDKPNLITIEPLINSKKKEELSGKDQVATSETDKKKAEEFQKAEFTSGMLPTPLSEFLIGKHDKNIEVSTTPVAPVTETISQNIGDNSEERKLQAAELIQKDRDSTKDIINAIVKKININEDKRDTKIIDSPKIISEEQERIEEIEKKVIEAFESAERKELGMSDVSTAKVSGVDVLDDADYIKDQSGHKASEDFQTEIKVEALPAISHAFAIPVPVITADIPTKSVAKEDNISELSAKNDSDKKVEEKCDEMSEDVPKLAISSSSQLSEEQKVEIDEHVDTQEQKQSPSIKGSVNIVLESEVVKKDIEVDKNKSVDTNEDKNMEIKVLEDTEKDSEQIKKETPIADLIKDEKNTLVIKISEESVDEDKEKHTLDIAVEPTSPVSQTSSLSPKQVVISRETSFLSSPKKMSVDEPPQVPQEILNLVDDTESKLEIHISEDKSDSSDKKIELFIDKPESYGSNLIHEESMAPDSPLIEKPEVNSLADTVDTLDDESDVSSESSTQTAFIARPYGTPRHRRLVRMDHVSPNDTETSPEKKTQDIESIKTDETSKSSDDLKTDETKDSNETSIKREDNAGSSQVDRKLESGKNVEIGSFQALDSIVGTESKSATVQTESFEASQQVTQTSDSNADGGEKVQESKDNVESIHKNDQVDVDDSTSLTDRLDSVNNLHGDRKKSGEQKITDSTGLLSVIQSKDSLKHSDDSLKISKSRDSSRERFSQNQDVSKDKLKSADKKTQQKPLVKKDSMKEKKPNQLSKDQINLPKKFVGKTTRQSKVSDLESEQSKEKIGIDRTKPRKRLDHEKIISEKSKSGRAVGQKTRKQESGKDQKVDSHTEDLKKKVKRIEDKRSQIDEIKLPSCNTKDKAELVLGKSPEEKKVGTESTVSGNADMKEIKPLVSDTEGKQVDKEICIEVEGEHTKADRSRKTSRKTEKIIIVEISSLKNRENKIEKIMEEKTTESYTSSETVEGTSSHGQLMVVEKSQLMSELVVDDEKYKMLRDKSPGSQKITRHYKEEPHEAQPRYMEWYKQNREEIERRRQEKKENEEEEEPPKWLRKSTRQRWLKMTPEDRKIFELKTPEVTPQRRKRIKPLVNVESEQLKAIVRQGRKLRKAEGGNGDPSIEIYAPERPPPPSLPSQSQVKHYRTQHSEYKYEKLPPPFYLHPPPAPHSTPQASPRSFEAPPESSSTELTHEQVTSPVIVSFQGGSRLRHQQLLEKKSVFDIAYSEAAPPHLRADSTTPPS
ncbi:uncharacterized protein [Chelonus insularis]|uniref:uncharacterized protein n=1 Tax=Chelonus insularis TaxID=460826 RepID=UPI00158D7BA7|nr:uncharacterized protein LOC118073307 [Chelonus insularis]